MWIVGCNQPGYLPETEPTAYGTWADARDALGEEVEMALDEAVRMGAMDDAEQAQAALVWIAKASEAEDGREGGQVYRVGSWVYWMSEVPQ
jgi:hypothetical protein